MIASQVRLAASTLLGAQHRRHARSTVYAAERVKEWFPDATVINPNITQIYCKSFWLCYYCSVAVPLTAVYVLITWSVGLDRRNEYRIDLLRAWLIFSGTICLHGLGGGTGAVIAGVSSLMYGMVFWSYTSACFTFPGSPISYKAQSFDDSYNALPQHRVDQVSFTSVTVKDDGTERFCQKCQCRKPDRTHHCRSCNRCVLKMDHHCPWLATCIGFRNHKQFVQFLLYVSTWCIFMCTCTSVFLWDFFTVNQAEEVEAQFLPINWVVLLVLSGVIGLVVGGFGAWHVSLVLRNYTTIEHMEETRFKGDQRRYLTAQSPKDKFNIFDLSYRENWTQVFGSSVLMWFLPIPSDTSLDGFSFPISARARERLRVQQNLHSFERTQEETYGNDHRYQLDDYRESTEWGRV